MNVGEFVKTRNDLYTYISQLETEVLESLHRRKNDSSKDSRP